MEQHHLTKSRLMVLRAALVPLVRSISPTHHATFTLSPGAPRWALEDRIGEWVVRVNRCFMGRNWYRPDRRDLRLKGFVFFETGKAGDNHHVHAIIRRPELADLLKFEQVAPHLFDPTVEDELQPMPKSLATGGQLHLQPIGADASDLQKLVRYDSKEMERGYSAYEDWCFIDDLTRQGRK